MDFVELHPLVLGLVATKFMQKHRLMPNMHFPKIFNLRIITNRVNPTTDRKSNTFKNPILSYYEYRRN